MSPPLTITREQIDEMVSILRQGIIKAMEEVTEADAAVTAEGHHHPSPA
jgi:hypothetical protein